MTDRDFLNHLLKRGYFKNHSKVIVALSGGLDSMFLFHLLSTYKNELNIELVVAHVNHKQRPESDEEEEALRNLARQTGTPFYVDHFTGHFTEASARQFRYDFFREVMRETSATALVTAHHADDQVETIFMRLIRGFRLHHLSAIKEKQKFDRGELIRPLLSFYKSDFPETIHFEDVNGIKYKSDKNGVIRIINILTIPLDFFIFVEAEPYTVKKISETNVLDDINLIVWSN